MSDEIDIPELIEGLAVLFLYQGFTFSEAKRITADMLRQSMIEVQVAIASADELEIVH